MNNEHDRAGRDDPMQRNVDATSHNSDIMGASGNLASEQNTTRSSDDRIADDAAGRGDYGAKTAGQSPGGSGSLTGHDDYARTGSSDYASDASRTSALGGPQHEGWSDHRGSDRDRQADRDDGGSADLIESDRVEGTAVYNRDGDRLGTVRRFLVEKRSGKARYAEMAFGGFLGIGEDVHPLPWDVLSYDESQGGYVVDLSEDQLRDGPRYERSDRSSIDAAYDQQIRSYYGLNPAI
jgi:hypothetical protein